ncbi:PP2C family protein-serine/threonine phosphatase [uncultured Jatrophihabitans sp.]|uniref:PP2C family protein-serine/threonine phosphatase n=1 Tax=uncultured Jatrophihabitans sp. TaxID=1610747 RepID=UPI0035CB5B38
MNFTRHVLKTASPEASNVDVEPAASTSSDDPSRDLMTNGSALVHLSVRARVDEAFAFDRRATRLLYLAENQLARTEAELAQFVDSGHGSPSREELVQAVDEATDELADAAAFRARCRDALSETLDGFTVDALSSRGRADGSSLSAAAAAVVAEATAIAATAEQTLAGEMHTGIIQAAKKAAEAVAAAAVTVARAAEASRLAREEADARAAADVADRAAATAVSVQDQADVLAAATAAAAAVRIAVERLLHADAAADADIGAATLEAELVAATARSQAGETAAAARIVASAVAADADAVAAVTSSAAAATKRDVLAAATVVRAEADAAARELALPKTAEPGESPAPVSDQQAVDAQRAASQAAATAAAAAQSARGARSAAASKAAATVAQAAAQTADAVQTRADELAAIAAARSAAVVEESLSPATSSNAQSDRADAAMRARAATAADAAAVAQAEQTAVAAALVARTVEATAEAIAARNSAEEVVIENHVRDTALAMQATTTATAVQLAATTREREAAVALATRAAAVAVERVREANRQLARASRHDRAVAVALQQAMLSDLPGVAGMTMAARYVTANEEHQVGGDWYDALLLPSGALTVMVGDVMGHDIAAAAMMGQLRNLLRALVWENRQGPAEVVGRLDSLLRDLKLKTLVTLILVNVEDATDGESVATVRWTNAGHPAPILIHADGTALVLEDDTDILLGVTPGAVRHDHEHSIPAGATLLLYTDGLIETRSESIDHGRQRLLDVARAHYRLEPGELLDAVRVDMIGDHPTDDVAMLAVRFGD